jgi:thiamine kinase-like enzyme
MLKNLKKNILSLFLGLNLKPKTKNLEKLEKAIKTKKRFYGDSVGENLFLKVRLQKKQKVAKDLASEIAIYKKLKEKFSEKSRFFPKLVSYGKYKNLFWFLKKLEKGIWGGQMDEDFGMKKTFLLKVAPRHFAQIVRSYQDIKPKFTFYIHGGWWYWQDFNRYKETFLNKFIKSKFNKNLLTFKDINSAQQILQINKKNLDQEAKCLSHGDLYPNNIILNNEGKLIIIDWGMANLNNFAFDIAFIYLMAHRSLNWQENFLNTYLKQIKEKNRFKELFKIALISLTTRFAAHCYHSFTKKPKKEILLILGKHIKTLKKAIYSKL